jgi:hypothetical protein
LAVVCIALIAAVVVKTRADAEAAAREAANYTPPPLSAPTPTPTAAPGPVVAIVGDTSTLTTGAKVTDSSQWPAGIGSSLRADVRSYLSTDARYAGASTTYLSELQKVPTNAKVIVFVGGTGDQYDSALTLGDAATTAFGAAHARAPKAAIVVVGPVSGVAPASQSLLQVRDTLQSAALIAKATWVDPINGNWLSGTSGLVAADGTPAAKGEQVLQSRLKSVLGPLVG